MERVLVPTAVATTISCRRIFKSAGVGLGDKDVDDSTPGASIIDISFTMDAIS